MNNILLRSIPALSVVAALALDGRGVVAAEGGAPGSVAAVPVATKGLRLRRHPAGAWEEVTGEIKIEPGAFLKTEAAGAIAVLNDGTEIELGPLTVLQFHVGTEINLEPGAPTRVSRVGLHAGMIRVTIPDGGRPALLMAPMETFVALRPGAGRARVTPEGLVVAVDRGGARVAVKGVWTGLSAGYYQHLKASGPQARPRPIPALPTFETQSCRASSTKACAIAVVVDDGRAKLGVQWKAGAPGDRFFLDLLRGDENGPVISHVEMAADETSFVSDALPAGSYVLSLRSVSPEGVEGQRSLRKLRILRLLPDLGVRWLRSADVLVVPPGRRIRVDGDPSVEMAQQGEEFGPARGQIGLWPQDQSRLVRFRLPGDSSDEAALTLERSSLRADVELTPSTATWPRDRVELRFRLRDPKGRTDTRAVHPRVRARINDETVQLGLAHEGEEWKATIPARCGSGPWAVRVDVLDTDENLLGYGVLNVVGEGESSPRVW